jgi:hypothetical protein
MRTSSRRLFTLLSVLLALSACSERGQAATPAPHAAADGTYTVLGPDLKRLRDDFNADAGKLRLVYIVGATCPECLRGMDDLGKALSAEQDDPRLRVYVVYVPALGATAADIPPTLSLLPGKDVSRYWDPTGTSGKRYRDALGIRQFAWDVWMIYRPGQHWDQESPPKPDFWMDQLDGLPPERFLDPDKFAKQVRAYLAPSR